jgi:hypothetical protein
MCIFVKVNNEALLKCDLTLSYYQLPPRRWSAMKTTVCGAIQHINFSNHTSRSSKALHWREDFRNFDVAVTASMPCSYLQHLPAADLEMKTSGGAA